MGDVARQADLVAVAQMKPAHARRSLHLQPLVPDLGRQHADDCMKIHLSRGIVE